MLEQVLSVLFWLWGGIASAFLALAIILIARLLTENEQYRAFFRAARSIYVTGTSAPPAVPVNLPAPITWVGGDHLDRRFMLADGDEGRAHWIEIEDPVSWGIYPNTRRATLMTIGRDGTFGFHASYVSPEVCASIMELGDAPDPIAFEQFNRLPYQVRRDFAWLTGRDDPQDLPVSSEPVREPAQIVRPLTKPVAGRTVDLD